MLIIALMKSSFQYLNDYFDKIVVLTLPRLTDRITYINKTLEGLNFEFFFGTDKEKTTIEELKEQGLYSTALYREFYKKPTEISSGMLCCALGHVSIYEYIIENGFQRTLVLEDDVEPLYKHLSKFPVITKELPEDWELLYLGYEKNETLGIREKLSRFMLTKIPHHAQLKISREIFRHYYPVPFSPHIAKAGFHDCCHAYALTLGAAKKLLKHSKPVGFHPDNLLSYMNCTGQLNGYISRLKLFNQLSAFVNKFDSLTAS